MDALGFAALCQELASIARSHGLDVPGFRSGPARTIKRNPAGSVVTVPLQGREHRAVSEDLIAGIVKTNGIPDSHPAVVEMIAAAAGMRLDGAR